MMQEEIKKFAKEFLSTSEHRNILVVSHFDTDGITSAAIFGRSLKKLDRRFSFNIIKNLDTEFVQNLPQNKLIIFLDLASGLLDEIAKLQTDIFIIDHHEIDKTILLPSNVRIINPHLYSFGEEMSAACLTYLVSRELTKKDSNSADLAVVGMVGDLMETKIGPLTNSIIKDAEANIKKGLLLYPSTRPLNKTLEYCSNPFIPGVTGDSKGAYEILREANVGFTEKGYKSLSELTEEEMQKITTAIALRLPNPNKIQEFIGNLYMIKFFNRTEDARELSALINACSRMDESNIALLFCMGNETARRQAETVYIKYKQSLIDALNQVHLNPKIEGQKYVIINAKDKIQDTIIGTVASIMSMSALYREGTIIITMAYNENKIKVSSRICGRGKLEEDPRNLKELMTEVTEMLGGESGGHKFAAGCIIDKEQEQAFIELVKKKLDLEIVKV
jgi:RecJ-like exonuclease